MYNFEVIIYLNCFKSVLVFTHFLFFYPTDYGPRMTLEVQIE